MIASVWVIEAAKNAEKQRKPVRGEKVNENYYQYREFYRHPITHRRRHGLGIQIYPLHYTSDSARL